MWLLGVPSSIFMNAPIKLCTRWDKDETLVYYCCGRLCLSLPSHAVGYGLPQKSDFWEGARVREWQFLCSAGAGNMDFDHP